MASSGKTEKLGLSLWEASDRPERMDFRQDNEQLERFIGEHLDMLSLHLTPEEKTFLARPFWIDMYTGTGNDNRITTTKAHAEAILVMCGEHPPCVTREDGKTDLYWDFWYYHKVSDSTWGLGGVEMEKGSSARWTAHSNLTSEKNSNVILHLNDRNVKYVALFLPSIG